MFERTFDEPPLVCNMLPTTLKKIERDDKGNENIYLDLTKVPHPVTRVMGAYCLIRTDLKKHQQVLDKLTLNTTEIEWIPFGCIVQRKQVGQIVREMIKNPDVLGFYITDQ